MNPAIPLPASDTARDRPAEGARSTVADVALPVPLRRTFAYSIPEELRGRVQAGCRVTVSFGNRLTTGFVVGLDPSDAPEELKPLRSLVDEEPLLDESILSLTRWIAERTLCSWGEALRAALPGHAAPKRERAVQRVEPLMTDLFGGGVAGEAGPGSTREERLLAAVADGEEVALPRLARRLGCRTADLKEDVKRLAKAGRLRVIERIAASAPVGPARVKMVRLRENAAAAADSAQELLARAPVQARVIDLLRSAGGELPLRDLAESLAGSRGAVKRLVEKKLVRVSLEAFEGVAPGEAHVRLPLPELMPEQAVAVDALVAAVGAGAYRTFLLHGVTGSGKTEVYLRAMAEARRLGRQSILLVPEITLTPQTVSRLRGRFGGRAAVVHSRMQDTERRRIWHGARRGDYDVVLGPRSAIFAPLPDVGLIVIDEEHDGAYKQEDAPRYQARDVAMERARAAGAVVVLGSATPDIETYVRATRGEMEILRLAQRVSTLRLPEVKLVDQRKTKGSFSPELLGAIQDRLKKKEQVILFLNRRGFAPFVQCAGCGEAVRCESCAVTLTYHKPDAMLRCHYCDHARPMPKQCPQCRGGVLQMRGAGTQRIEEELVDHFPRMRIARLDSDSVRRAGAHEEILGKFLEGEIDVLLGTQMVAKGLDFPRVTLVGVINSDTGLHLPDYRSTERTFQLLAQVSGRAGRSELGGTVLVQTRCPDHPCLTAARDHDDAAFRDAEVIQRKAMRYPPFTRLASVLVRGPDKVRTEEAAERVGERLTAASEAVPGWTEVLGPAEAPLVQIRGKWRYRLLVKGDDREDVRTIVSEALGPPAGFSEVDVSVDVDPLDML